jgi:O-antigen ligase
MTPNQLTNATMAHVNQFPGKNHPNQHRNDFDNGRAVGSAMYNRQNSENQHQFNAISSSHSIGGIAANKNGPTYPHHERVREEIVRMGMVLVATLAFVIVILTFAPFDTTVYGVQTAEGDKVNQIGSIALFAIMGFLLLTCVNFRRITGFLTPTWILFICVVFVGIIKSPDALASSRMIFLTLVAAFTSFSVLLIPKTMRDLRMVLLLTALIVITISYVGLVLFPDVAKHGSDGFETQHFGLWRGPYAHKNIAGPIMSVIAIIGIYVWRTGSSILAPIITLAAFIFMLKTGSKTTTGFLPIVIMIIFFSRIFGSPRLAILANLVVVFTMLILTLGTIFSEQLENMTTSILADPSFTGRVSLWTHGLYTFFEKPYLGLGLNSFWNTNVIINGPLPSYAQWDFRKIINGHSNYVDVLLYFGMIGGGIIFLVLYILPIFNYVKAYKTPSNRKLADMFMMIIFFLTLISLMETYVLTVLIRFGYCIFLQSLAYRCWPIKNLPQLIRLI